MKSVLNKIFVFYLNYVNLMLVKVVVYYVVSILSSDSKVFVCVFDI